MTDSEFKLVGHDLRQYPGGLRVGDTVRLRSDIVVRDHRNKPTGKVYPAERFGRSASGSAASQTSSGSSKPTVIATRGIMTKGSTRHSRSFHAKTSNYAMPLTATRFVIPVSRDWDILVACSTRPRQPQMVL
jgi:hypothetical protein